jgi:biopolymer transport protein ExbD
VWAGNRQPLVQLKVDNGANQQRVMDVLNAFVAAKIQDVTFSDQEE